MSDTLHIMALLATAHLFAVMSPGPNQALILATAARNRNEGLIVAAGFWPAGYLWASMGLLGMGELMRSAPMIELGLRVGCGLYLIYMGVRMFRASFGDRTKLGSAAPEQSKSKLFLMGFLTNLGNAKAIAICDPCRLGCSQALAHNGMLLMEDQVFKVNFWTRVSNPSAHDDLG